jgi:cytochrome c oxidase assembly protein subunit 11
MQTLASPTFIQRLNWRMVKKLSVVVALMFGFGYALVPMYSAICNALGINILSRSELQTSGQGGGGAAAANTQIDTSRTITVEFDANARGPWDFKPATRTL